MPTPTISQVVGNKHYDHTNDAGYSLVVNTLLELQTHLLDNPHFRAPDLDILLSVYDNSDLDTRRRIGRTRPTDADVCIFFRDNWPEVQVANMGSQYLGFTNSGRDAANESNIQVSRGLVCHLREVMAGNKTAGASEAELRLLFIAVVLREIGHRLLVWWSRGECDIPTIHPYSSEAGEHIEKAFFTGIMGETPSAGKRRIRTIKKLRGINLRMEDNARVTIGATDAEHLLSLDQSTAKAVLNKFSIPLQTLPLMSAVTPVGPVKIKISARPSPLKKSKIVDSRSDSGVIYCSWPGRGCKRPVTSPDQLKLIYMN